MLLVCGAGTPALYCLLEMAAVASDYFAPRFVNELDWIKVLLLLCVFV